MGHRAHRAPAVVLLVLLGSAPCARADETGGSVSPPVAPWYADEWGWALLAGGVISAGAGTGFLLHGRSLRDEAESGHHDQVESIRLSNEADAWRTAGAISLVAGAAVLAGGIVKLVLHDASPPSPSLRVTLGPGWVGVAGRF